jgi:hypothetical protein
MHTHLICQLRELLDRFLAWLPWQRDLEGEHVGAHENSPRLRETKRPVLDEFAKPRDILQLAGEEQKTGNDKDREAFARIWFEFLAGMEAASRQPLVSEATGQPLARSQWDRSMLPIQLLVATDGTSTDYRGLAKLVDDAFAEADAEMAVAHS